MVTMSWQVNWTVFVIGFAAAVGVVSLLYTIWSVGGWGKVDGLYHTPKDYSLPVPGGTTVIVKGETQWEKAVPWLGLFLVMAATVALLVWYDPESVLVFSNLNTLKGAALDKIQLSIIALTAAGVLMLLYATLAIATGGKVENIYHIPAGAIPPTPAGGAAPAPVKGETQGGRVAFTAGMLLLIAIAVALFVWNKSPRPSYFNTVAVTPENQVIKEMIEKAQRLQNVKGYKYHASFGPQQYRVTIPEEDLIGAKKDGEWKQLVQDALQMGEPNAEVSNVHEVTFIGDVHSAKASYAVAVYSGGDAVEGLTFDRSPIRLDPPDLSTPVGVRKWADDFSKYFDVLLLDTPGIAGGYVPRITQQYIAQPPPPVRATNAPKKGK